MDFLSERKIPVAECKLMTTHDRPRALTFRLAVSKADGDKVTASDFWSPDILIEPYRKKKRRNSRRMSRENNCGEDLQKKVNENDGLNPFSGNGFGNKKNQNYVDQSVWLRKPSTSH